MRDQVIFNFDEFCTKLDNHSYGYAIFCESNNEAYHCVENILNIANTCTCPPSIIDSIFELLDRINTNSSHNPAAWAICYDISCNHTGVINGYEDTDICALWAEKEDILFKNVIWGNDTISVSKSNLIEFL